MTCRAIVILVAALVALIDAAPAGQSGSPAGPATGAITGTVKSPRGGSVRGARVTLNGPSTFARTAIADSRGQFAFTALPPGRFMLAAEHPLFLPALYGQKGPGKPGASIELAEAQRVDVQLQLVRGSAITGTVVDEQGDVLIGARVRALQFVVNQNGVRRLRVVDTVRADDRGIYRFYRLAPGDYFVSASPESLAGDPELGMNAIALFERGLQADLDTSVEPPLPVPFRTSDGAEDSIVEGVAPTYHPNATRAGASVSVHVDGVAEHSGIDIRIVPMRNATIRGAVTGIPRSTAWVQVLLHNADAAEEPTTLTVNATDDGQFELRNIAPGQYAVYAQTMPPVERGGMDVQAVRVASFDRLHGSAPVIVDGPDPPPLAIALRPGRSISGRVVRDFARPPTGPSAAAPTTISITPSPRPAGLPAFNTSPQTQVDADGYFTLPGIRPGQYFLRASGPGSVRSVMLNGVDTLDVPLDLNADTDIAGVVMTLTDRLSELSGIVTTAAGRPVTDCTVLVLSTDSRFWIAGSRRVAATEPAPDGRYGFRGLPAGEYRLAVVSDFDPASRFDTGFLRGLLGESVAVTITEGAVRRQDLRIAR